MKKENFNRNLDIENKVISVMAGNCNIGISYFSKCVDILFQSYFWNGTNVDQSSLEFQNILCCVMQIKKMCEDLDSSANYMCALGFEIDKDPLFLDSSQTDSKNQKEIPVLDNSIIIDKAS